jgi:monoamine oxidase
MNQTKDYNVIIIGAGAAGLMAAWELVQAGKNVLILEAKSRLGGRIHTFSGEGFSVPIELGAEFVHGKLPLTKMLMEKAGVEWEEVKGSFWLVQGNEWKPTNMEIDADSKVINALKKVKQDISVADFLKQHFNNDTATCEEVKNYVEGYYAADVDRASTLAFREEMTSVNDPDFRIYGGYVQIIDYLEKQLKVEGCSMELNTPVTEIVWEAGSVKVMSGYKTFFTDKILITVPLGVLSAPVIKFNPSLPMLDEALPILGYGPAIKIILEFNERFWLRNTALNDLSMIFTEALIPVWWTQYPKENAILTGWIAGGMAKNLVHFKKEVLLQKALESLASIFDVSIDHLQSMLKAHYINNWYKGPYAKGAYSYATVDDSAARIAMKKGIVRTLYFAGEGWNDSLQIGTVEAALQSGRDTAHQIVADR